jgi:hypothetical protein
LLKEGAAGSDPTLRRAMGTARESERLFRKLLRYGLMHYGKDVLHHQFFLRRMTLLSTSLYWLVSSVSVLRGRHGDQSISAEERALLDYLIAEAKEVQRLNGTVSGGERERAHRALMQTASSESGDDRSGDGESDGERSGSQRHAETKEPAGAT